MSHLFLTLSWLRQSSHMLSVCSHSLSSLMSAVCPAASCFHVHQQFVTASLWLVWKIAEGRPGCQGAFKALSSIQRLHFICIQLHNYSDAQTNPDSKWVDLWSVSWWKQTQHDGDVTRTPPECDSRVFITHTVFLQLLFNLLFCGRHASSLFTFLEERASSCSLYAFRQVWKCVLLSQRK